MHFCRNSRACIRTGSIPDLLPSASATSYPSQSSQFALFSSRPSTLASHDLLATAFCRCAALPPTLELSAIAALSSSSGLFSVSSRPTLADHSVSSLILVLARTTSSLSSSTPSTPPTPSSMTSSIVLMLVNLARSAPSIFSVHSWTAILNFMATTWVSRSTGILSPLCSSFLRSFTPLADPSSISLSHSLATCLLRLTSSS
mmetsp:Transcript_7237/g.24884  ORF Transcript_7237/g.24884 Transcript_7237/m.24884 type:complete len:202 (+) Transcript_7237:302-907(+)